MQLERLVLFPPKKKKAPANEKLNPVINTSELDTAIKSEPSDLVEREYKTK